ncbi:hypothetical protein C1752_03384 [Acaryochloris thomasi RCC1774]|uniref:Uncharacterized protein n=1 Tax=Acaryochloris thomasi RCC1774 TaxID=1764569 RepID=A0A2W1JG40_9CYAN|nr:hypothetical protein C1752_03384 [Acaryochloris thomasi RCC1774]
MWFIEKPFVISRIFFLRKNLSLLPFFQEEPLLDMQGFTKLAKCFGGVVDLTVLNIRVVFFLGTLLGKIPFISLYG